MNTLLLILSSLFVCSPVATISEGISNKQTTKISSNDINDYQIELTECFNLNTFNFEANVTDFDLAIKEHFNSNIQFFLSEQFDGIYRVSDIDTTADVFVEYSNFPDNIKLNPYTETIEFNVILICNSDSQLSGKVELPISLLIPTEQYDIESAVDALEARVASIGNFTQDKYGKDQGLSSLDEQLSDIDMNPMWNEGGKFLENIKTNEIPGVELEITRDDDGGIYELEPYTIHYAINVNRTNEEIASDGMNIKNGFFSFDIVYRHVGNVASYDLSSYKLSTSADVNGSWWGDSNSSFGSWQTIFSLTDEGIKTEDEFKELVTKMEIDFKGDFGNGINDYVGTFDVKNDWYNIASSGGSVTERDKKYAGHWAKVYTYIRIYEGNVQIKVGVEVGCTAWLYQYAWVSAVMLKIYL